MRTGSYQCPKCGICAGIGWSGEPGYPPICCDGIRMIAYEILPQSNSSSHSTGLSTVQNEALRMKSATQEDES